MPFYVIYHPVKLIYVKYIYLLLSSTVYFIYNIFELWRVSLYQNSDFCVGALLKFYKYLFVKMIVMKYQLLQLSEFTRAYVQNQ